MKIQPVILCGGSGTRLWPLSREQYPKQMLALNGEPTLFQATLRRMEGLAGAAMRIAHPAILCNEAHRYMAVDQLRAARVDPAAVILEPVARGTAPALTLAALHPAADDDPVLLVMPSDHIISDRRAFQDAITRGAALADAGHVVTFGVTPTAPETGYGYIRMGEAVRVKGEQCGHYVQAFVEKPDAGAAQRNVDSGRYLWNSGIFAMRASTWIRCIGRFRPDILSACERARTQATWDGDFYRVDAREFADCPADSIDYAVMERLQAKSAGRQQSKAVVVKLDAGWSDVGAWKALWEIGRKDGDGNVTHGDVSVVDSADSLVIAQSRLVACVGVRDVVVVETPDAVMVANRDQAQRVKELVASLRSRGRAECSVHRKVHRPWGSYDGVDAGERFQVKRIVVNPGPALSLQMHHHRAEHWVVVRGTARVTRGDEEFLLSENESTYIPIGTRHRLENPGKLPLEIIEVQSGAYLGEDDIVRFEDQYGRVSGGSAAQARKAPSPEPQKRSARGDAPAPAIAEVYA